LGTSSLGTLQTRKVGVLRRVSDGHHGGVRAGMGHQQLLKLGTKLFVFFCVEVS